MGRKSNAQKKNVTPTKKAKESDAPRKPISPAWTKPERDNLKLLADLEMHTTRFADKDALAIMGILDDVERFLTAMGCPVFLHLDHPTYPEVTRHFLATLNVKYDEPTPIDEDDEETDMRDSQGIIQFRIGHKNFHFTIEEVCKAFGFVNDHFRSFDFKGSPSCLWTLLGEGPYRAQDARVHKVRNPIIRYTARLLAHTLFARKDVATVQRLEFVLINHALGENRIYKLPENVNMGCILIQSFLDIMGKVREGKAKHGVFVGGVITALLQRLGFNFKDEFMNKGKILKMDFNYLDEMNYAVGRRWVGGERRVIHEWLVEGETKRYCLLPNEFVPPTSRTNIRFEVPKELWIKLDAKDKENDEEIPHQEELFDEEDDDEDLFNILDIEENEYQRDVERCGPTPKIYWEPQTYEGKFFLNCATYQAKRNEVESKWIKRTFGICKKLVSKLKKFTKKTGKNKEKTSRGSTTREEGSSSRRVVEEVFEEEPFRHSISTGGIVIREPQMEQPRRHSFHTPTTGKNKGKRARYATESESDSDE